MIKVDKLSLETLKGRALIEDLSFVLNFGDKLAIIGEEGNGKSSLLKAIYDKSLIEDYCLVNGVVANAKSIGYLEQKLSSEWDNFSVLDYFLKATPKSVEDYDVFSRMHILEKLFIEYELNLDYLENQMLIKNLSGGEKVKLQLIKLLFNDYDAFFLDEPTNDLDIETLEKLESFMKSRKEPIMFISHDETLLENVANQILHIEQLVGKSKPKWTLKKSSYSDYVNERSRELSHQTQMAYSQKREREKRDEVLRQIKQKVEHQIKMCRRDPSTGRILVKKMANIKAQERRFENEETIEVPDVEEAIKFVIDKSIFLPSKKRVVEIDNESISVGDRVLVKNMSLTVFGCEKIAIVGKNGVGKTTFLRFLINKLNDVSNIKVGYFSQNYADNLDYNLSPIDVIKEANRGLNARTILGSLKFTKEEVEHKIRDLSEGQKAKILLLKLIVEKNNVLVLDEPTRNLSPLSNPVIRKMLGDFNGVIIAVSHDRKFISEVCNKTYLLTKDGLCLL